MPFTKTWIDLEDLILTQISQRKTNTVWVHSCVESNKQNKHSKTEMGYRYREQNVVAGLPWWHSG